MIIQGNTINIPYTGSFKAVQINKANTNIYCQTIDEELTFVNTHQCVVQEAELRLFSTWPCPRLSCLFSLEENYFILPKAQSPAFNLQHSRLKSSHNLWNRLYFYRFTAQCSVFYLWITRPAQREACLLSVPARPCPCCVAAGQSPNREVFQSLWTPPMLSFQAAPSRSWYISTNEPKERRDSNQHR